MNTMQLNSIGTQRSSASVQNEARAKLNEIGPNTSVDQGLRADVVQFFDQREDILWAAEQEKLAIDDQLAQRFESAKSDILVRAYIDQFFKNQKVEENVLKQAYQDYVKDLNGTEYELSIITAKSRADADAVTQEFFRTRCFGEVAAKYSINATAKAGGYIGWISEGLLAPVVRMVLQKLGPQQISEPIETPEGLHLLYFADSRRSVASAFEDVKSELEVEILAQRFNDHMASIRRQRKN